MQAEGRGSSHREETQVQRSRAQGEAPHGSRHLGSRPGLAFAGVTLANLRPSPRPWFPLLWHGDSNPCPYHLLGSPQTLHVYQGQPSARFLRAKEEASTAPEQWDWKVWTEGKCWQGRDGRGVLGASALAWQGVPQGA